MNSNLKLAITKQQRVGRTPFTVGRSSVKLPVIASGSPQTEVKHVLTAEQKLDALDRIVAKNGEYGRDAFATWMETLESDEEEEEVIQSEVHQLLPSLSSTDGVAKNLQSNFNNLVGNSFTSGNGNDKEEESEPECVQKVHEAMAINVELTKLRKEKMDSEIKVEAKEMLFLKFDKMVAEMNNNVIPALNKLLQEPTRFHDMTRKNPAVNSVPCYIEDQKKLVSNLTRLGDDCRQLTNLEFNANHLDKEFKFLGELANNVDSKVHKKAEEKLKLLTNMEELVQEPSRPAADEITVVSGEINSSSSMMCTKSF